MRITATYSGVDVVYYDMHHEEEEIDGRWRVSQEK